MRFSVQLVVGILVWTFAVSAARSQPSVDETPAAVDEWGFRPADGATVEMTPGSYTWRPQESAESYTLQISPGSSFSEITYAVSGWRYNVHTPPRTLAPGRYSWRVRYITDRGRTSEWSSIRSFTIAEDASRMPLPERDELLDRIPDDHPRLFVRPEAIEDLRERARTDLRPLYQNLVQTSEEIIKDPPSTAEPPEYPPGEECCDSQIWREIWWGNRQQTVAVLRGASTLAFTWLLGGEERYAEKARELLMAAAAWDPEGTTSFAYNDEAGMPYAYYFSRTYTFLNDYLSEEEKEICRNIMRIRGQEMYEDLYPRHLWKPYDSHSNRAWHFLGEVGIAFLGEIEQAREWVWFATNVFMNVYPVWNDTDGGWHEGIQYWRSYQNRFTWWADVMNKALRIDAFEKPFYSKVGYYPMYVMPPGTEGGGFGDLNADDTSQDNVDLMSIFAVQAGNPHWQWYVDAHGGAPAGDGYIGFLRAALSDIEAKPPTDLPTSKLFRGIGQAYMNTTLLDADDNVGLLFKSSPFGTTSHGYESQNAFLLYAFGERLFIRSGRRDTYGSEHHTEWMWHTKSVNSITVNGRGQPDHSQKTRGEITAFHTSKTIDYVEGEAEEAYDERLDRFTRRMVFIKPEAVLIFDVVDAPEPSSFQWWLHAPVEFRIHSQDNIRVRNGAAAARTSFLWPQEVDVSVTDEFNPAPQLDRELVQYHLTAVPGARSEHQNFVTVLRPHRSDTQLRGNAELTRIDGGYAVRVPLEEGEARVLLQDDAGPQIRGLGITTDAAAGAVVFDEDGNLETTFASEDGSVRVEE